MTLSAVNKEIGPRKPSTPPGEAPKPAPIIAPTGNAKLDAVADVLNNAAAPFQSAPPPEQGTLGVISHGMGAVLGVVGAPFEMLDTGFAMATAGLAAMMPGLPAATLTAPHLGMPHGHAHPPSLIPPAPPVPLPSIGVVAAAGCVSVLVGGLPAARAGDVGPAPTCGSLGPIFEVYTGSSNTFIGGSRAARMTDITRHCNPASALGAFGKAMGAVGVIAGAVGAGAQAAAGAAAAAAMQAAQAAADAVALAMSAFLGKDPGIPPAMGALMFGNPTVLIGGFPLPDLLDVAGGLVSAAKKIGGAAKKFGKKAAKLRSQICLDPSEPISLTSGEVYNDFKDATLDPHLEWTFERHYRSGWVDELGPMGRGFRHSYEKRMELRRRTAVFVDHNGVEVEFPRKSDGEPYGGIAFGYVLRQLDELNFSLQTPGEGGEEYRFRRAHRRAERARLVELRPGPRAGRLPSPIWLEYDHVGKLARLWRAAPAGKLEVRLHYDASGRLVGLERRAANEQGVTLARYAYDDAQHLVGVRNALGAQYTYRYADHRMARAQDPRGYGFSWTYDHLGRCISCRGDDGLWQVSIEYEVGKTIVTEGDGGVWAYVYNQDKIITQVIDPLGGVKQYRLDEHGTICKQIDAAGLVTRWLYDQHGHHYARLDPWGALVPPENQSPNPATGRELAIPRMPRELQLGTPGRFEPRSIPLPDLEVVALPERLRQHAHAVLWAATRRPTPPLKSFDAGGNVVSARDAWGGEERTSYSALGEPLQITDADGRTTQRTYASWSLLAASTDPNGASTRYAYDHREKIVAITDPRGHTVRYGRDACGRIESIFNSGELEERYERDPAGRVVATYSGNGELLVNYVYGEHGQCVKRTQASGETHRYAYDHRGNVCEASSDEVGVQLAYDWKRRVILDQRDGKGIVKRQLGFDGKVVRMFARFETRYTEDHGSVEIVTSDGSTHRVRPFPGGMFERVHADGHHELSHFDGQGRCTGRYLWNAKRGDEVQWYARYHYSPAGELLKAEDSARGTTSFAYDAAHRLMGLRRSDGTAVEFRYDPAGNLLRNGFYPWLRADARNQLVEGPGEAFTYDRRYHLESHTRESVTARYVYDGVDRLIRVTWSDGRPDWIAAYDGLGRRLYKEQGGKRTDFYWDGPRLAAEQRPDGTLRSYVYPNEGALVPIMFLDYDGVDAEPSSGKRYTVFCDQVGQPAVIYDAQGATVWAVAQSDPYGALDLDSRSRIDYALRFPGHYSDPETGLYCNRFRYYSPTLGRYLQSDPMGQAGGIHVYAYPTNPLVDVDVFGLMHLKKDAEGGSAPDATGPKQKDASGDADADSGKQRRTLSDEEAAKIKADLDAKAKVIIEEMDAAWARGERTVPADRLPPGVTAPEPLKTKPVNDPKDGRGPCLTLTQDLDTGEVFATQNQPTRPTNEHPLVTQRTDERIASNQENFNYKNEDWKSEGRTRSGRPGTHSEVHGTNAALNDRSARNEAGDHPPGKPYDESDMDGLVVHNTRTEEGPNKGAPMPRCHNCAPITDGAHAINDP